MDGCRMLGSFLLCSANSQPVVVSTRRVAWLLWLTLLLTGLVEWTVALQCPPLSQCDPLTPCDRSVLAKCAGGVVRDVCGCCDTCAKVENETCGGLHGLKGECDEGLICVFVNSKVYPPLGDEEGICQGEFSFWIRFFLNKKKVYLIVVCLYFYLFVIQVWVHCHCLSLTRVVYHSDVFAGRSLRKASSFIQWWWYDASAQYVIQLCSRPSSFQSAVRVAQPTVVTSIVGYRGLNTRKCRDIWLLCVENEPCIYKYNVVAFRVFIHCVVQIRKMKIEEWSRLWIQSRIKIEPRFKKLVVWPIQVLRKDGFACFLLPLLCFLGLEGMTLVGRRRSSFLRTNS